MYSEAKAIPVLSIIYCLEIIIRYGNWNERSSQREERERKNRQKDRANWLRHFMHIRTSKISVWISCVYHFQFSLRQLITAKLTREPTKADRAVSFLPAHSPAPFYWLSFFARARIIPVTMRRGKGPEISFASNYSEKMDFAMWRCERNTIVRPTISPNPLREILITLSGTKYQRKSRITFARAFWWSLREKFNFTYAASSRIPID